MGRLRLLGLGIQFIYIFIYIFRTAADDRFLKILKVLGFPVADVFFPNVNHLLATFISSLTNPYQA